MSGVRAIFQRLAAGSGASRHAAGVGARADQEVSLRTLEKRIWPARFGLAALLFLAYLLREPGGRVLPLAVVGGAYLVGYLSLAVTRVGFPAYSASVFALDVVAISAAVLVSGGAGSVFALAYAFPVVVMAIARGARTGVVLATVTALLYLLAAGANRPPGTGVGGTVALVAWLYGLAVLAGVVHDRIQRGQLELDANLVKLYRGLASFMEDGSIVNVLERSLELGVELTGAARGAVVIWGENHRRLHLYTLAMEEDAAVSAVEAQAVAASHVHLAPLRVARTGEWRRDRATPPSPLSNLLYVPIPELGGWQGAFCFADRTGRGGFSAQDEQVAGLLAARVATAVTRRRAIEQRLQAYDGLLRMLVVISDSREHASAGHSERVSRYARLIGEELGVDGEELELVAVGGLLHDIGKIGVADEIIAKPGILDDDQRAIMMTHSQIAEAIVSQAGPLARVSLILRSHHERWDGRGYPDSLSGEEIPLGARIVAVADAIESMLANRPYRARMSVAAAMDEIQRYSGTQFDPAVVAASLRAIALEGGAASQVAAARAKITLPEVNAMVQSARWRLFTRLASEIDILLDLPELGDRLLSLICGELEVSGAALLAMESDPDQLRVIARHGSPAFLLLGDVLDRGDGIPWAAVDGGEALTVPDVTAHPSYCGLETATTMSAVYVPLRSTSGIRGVISLYRELGHTFDPQETAYLDALAVPIAELLTISELHAEASKAAITDSLTGAASRMFGFDRLRSACANSGRTAKACAVLMLDVDGFKEVNDRYGHRAGDEVLRVSVSRLKAQLRAGDTLARYGGDEFMMILEDTTEMDVMALVERISRGEPESVVSVDGVAFELPAWSAGFAIYPEDGREPDELVRVADSRLYAQKGSRRWGETNRTLG